VHSEKWWRITGVDTAASGLKERDMSPCLRPTTRASRRRRRPHRTVAVGRAHDWLQQRRGDNVVNAALGTALTSGWAAL
jgi:hypothetical protein